MKCLVDQAVSWQVARDLKAAGHDAVHVRGVGLASAGDGVILRRAADQQRVIITQDTDFGTLLTAEHAERPSVILLRLRQGQPEVHVRVLLENLPALEADLIEGAIVVLTDTTIRVRRLPSKE